MLEDKIDALIAALDRNTAALGGTAAAPAAAAAAAEKPAPATGKPALTVVGGAKVTLPMVKAAVIAVKDEYGKPAAQKIIREAGKAAEMAAIPPANFRAVLAACAALKAQQEEPDDDTAEDAVDDSDTL